MFLVCQPAFTSKHIVDYRIEYEAAQQCVEHSSDRTVQPGRIFLILYGPISVLFEINPYDLFNRKKFNSAFFVLLYFNVVHNQA